MTDSRALLATRGRRAIIVHAPRLRAITAEARHVITKINARQRAWARRAMAENGVGC
jgi:hypothetical protein